jgi:replication factor A2
MGDYGYGAYGGYGGGDEEPSRVGGGAGGGGGFINEPTSQGSPSKRGGDKARIESVVPLTVRMALAASEHPEGGFDVDGRPVQKLSLVCRVLSMESGATSTRFRFEDGTGEISGTFWHGDDTRVTDACARLEQGMYVALFGQLKVFADKKTINVLSLRPLQDSNQISHHMLEVVLAHLQATKGALSKGAAAGAAGGSSSSGGAGAHSYNANLATAHAPAFASNYAAPAGLAARQQHAPAAPAPGAGDLQQKLIDIYSRPDVEGLEEGLSVADAHKELQRLGFRAVSEADVKKMVENLSGEGHLYSTTDEYHYKSTGGG